MAIIRYEHMFYTPNAIVNINSASYINKVGSSVFVYDSSKYTSPTIYLEAYMKSVTASTNDSYFKLVDIGASVRGDASGTDVTSSEIRSTSTTLNSYRSSSLTLTNGSNFKIMVKQGSASATVCHLGVRLVILDDVGANAPSNILSEIPLMLNSNSAGTSTSTSYAEVSASSYYPHDTSKFDGTITTYFEAHISSSNASGVGYCDLYDLDAGATVANSEVSFTGNNITYGTRSRSSAITLTNSHRYVVRLKSNNASYTARVWKASIIHLQSGTITKTRVTMSTSTYNSGISGTYYTTNMPAVMWNNGDWTSSSKTVYVSGDIWNASGSGNCYGGLLLAAGTLLANAEVTTTSTSRVRYYSGTACSPADATNYIGGYKNNGSVSSAMLLMRFEVEVTWAAGAVVKRNFGYIFG